MARLHESEVVFVGITKRQTAVYVRFLFVFLYSGLGISIMACVDMIPGGRIGVQRT
jgi:hypothetical protein